MLVQTALVDNLCRSFGLRPATDDLRSPTGTATYLLLREGIYSHPG
jgi:hypothetical protein